MPSTHEWRYTALREAPLWLVVRHCSRTAADTRAFFAAASRALEQPLHAAPTAATAPTTATASVDGLCLLSDLCDGGGGRLQTLDYADSNYAKREIPDKTSGRKRSRSTSPLPLPSTLSPDRRKGAEACPSAALKSIAERWRVRLGGSTNQTLPLSSPPSPRQQQQQQHEYRSGGVCLPPPCLLEQVALDVLLAAPVHYTSIFQTVDEPQHVTPICLALAGEHFLSSPRPLSHARGAPQDAGAATAELAEVVSRLRAMQEKVFRKASAQEGSVARAEWRPPPKKLGCVLFAPVLKERAATVASTSVGAISETARSTALPFMSANSTGMEVRKEAAELARPDTVLAAALYPCLSLDLFDYIVIV